MADELSFKEKQFSEAYVIHAGNGVEAARDAGYAGDNNTLKVQAARMLDRPRVQDAIADLVSEHTMTALECLEQLADVARADWREFLQIKTVRGEVVDVRMDLTSKVKALELVGKYHKLFTDKIEATLVAKALIGINLEDV